MSNLPTDGAITASKRELVRGLAIAFGVAAVALTVAVLPAEYGIDPTGAGKLFGLTALKAPSSEASAIAPTANAPTTPGAAPAATGAGAAQSADRNAKKPSTIASQQTPIYRSDTREITLAAGKGIEVKTKLEQGAALIYSWKTKNGELVNHDFHGEPPNAKNDEYESFIKGKDVAESRGVLIAPFTGTHGWYWKNRKSEPVTIVLQVSGFYTEIFNP